ncbi:hypothetical protein DICPUDRAFT_159393 [Dictyostelium purpureum]|uniref:NADH:flavin oxidoreductase/NADH oxidase N-terminal domain-containing protein n=1 Tax=Dictyostelium purpureum TaxID=5786 RepID=F1A408_DICPU|nr:uncharacterized protein DICPUDRAFT_159393 [Dictyostelium purpureum]EGC29069.1 hypothetical protein DICPUDRAFT_159393 [Dictyostelium purpureum]|eukprot:XP_003294401.1 hypothetical protein DICPUDRAFT_159393 [Dictyostelium purpureum]
MATATSPEGRISYSDNGLWKDGQKEQLKRVIDFCKIFGPHMGIQIAHEGKKASTEPPFLGHRNKVYHLMTLKDGKFEDN